MKKPPKKTKKHGFSEPVKVFIEALVAAPNVTRAYMLAYPKCKADSAAPSGFRLLRNVQVREAVEAGRRKRLEALAMDGDEAMQRIALIARTDIRELFDEDGRILPPTAWPAELALAVKGIKDREHGREVTFDSRLSALEMIASAHGKLKRTVEVDSDVLSLLLKHATPADKGES